MNIADPCLHCLVVVESVALLFRACQLAQLIDQLQESSDAGEIQEETYIAYADGLMVNSLNLNNLDRTSSGGRDWFVQSHLRMQGTKQTLESINVVVEFFSRLDPMGTHELRQGIQRARQSMQRAQQLAQQFLTEESDHSYAMLTPRMKLARDLDAESRRTLDLLTQIRIGLNRQTLSRSLM